ncbi:MAG: thioredoxin-dependent thiol peroxidase [Flavobacteriales bacterium]|nr:thioredoxin-dependent thiol peroxidase [Flavobacteriales bacterium]|tara:strand:- start:1416 stop:1877 length:462 start_codon:yes stop_codon:yes gene_type:complete
MTKLKEGDKAPDFRGFIESGSEVSLSNYRGKKLVLYFYPKDNTPGCTAQACNLTENQELLKNAGFEILGVSPDSVKKHQNFISKYSLGFSLIADEEKEVIKAYQVWGPKKFMGKEYDGIHRTTFIINEQGNIERVFTKVKTKEHAKQILESYK